MINLMLIAGNRVKSLAAFLEQRGTFEVEFCYDFLEQNLQEIQNQIIRVDRTLYLYQHSDFDGKNTQIRNDMKILQKLISNGSFFEPGEIVFMLKSDDYSKQAAKYFTEVMRLCKKTNYSIKLIDSELSYSIIYESLMGITSTRDFKNTYRSLYRVERNSNASIAYDTQDDSNLIIEPFQYENLRTYKTQKEMANTTDSGLSYQSDPDYEKTTLHSPSLGQLEVNDVLNRPICTLLTGASKSGLSIWTAALASSANTAGKSTCIIDFTSNGDITQLMRNNGIAIVESCLAKFLIDPSFSTGSITVCSIKNESEERVQLEFLQHIFWLGQLNFETVFIAVPVEKFNIVHKILIYDLTTVCITMVPLASGLDLVQDLVASAEDAQVTILLNESIHLLPTDSFLSAEKVKELLIGNLRVVKHHYFIDLEVGEGIYASIVLGGDTCRK